MTRFEMVSEPVLKAPVLVASFDGWVNAGNAGTGAVDILSVGSEPVVSFESDDLFDYRDTRPVLTFREGVVQSMEPPSVSMAYRAIGERDVLILTGTEPSLGWGSFTRTLVELAERFSVAEYVALGGIPWATPHTRPVTLITTASSRDRIPDAADHPEGILTVPGSISSAIDLAMIGYGVPTLGLWARVPHYLGARFVAASLTLLERLDQHLDLGLDLADLAAEADAQRLQLDSIAEGRPDVRSMIEQLEELVDGADVGSGEQLASEIERFLRNRSDGDFE